MLNSIIREKEVKMTQTTSDIMPFLADNYIFFQKNGKIEMRKIPDFGSLIFTSQDGKIVQIETRIKER